MKTYVQISIHFEHKILNYPSIKTYVLGAKDNCLTETFFWFLQDTCMYVLVEK